MSLIATYDAFTLKHDSSCCVCGTRLHAGERAQWWSIPVRGVRCGDCGVRPKRIELSAPAPTPASASGIAFTRTDGQAAVIEAERIVTGTA
jgi:hypothetical protein